jgi:DNA-binding transcriptional LysR family regulator
MAADDRLLSGIGAVIAVVEAGSFARAAETLGLTQSGVSRAVARLERRVGVRVFHRTARAVTLTDEGRRFYEEVAPLLAGIEDAATHVAGSAAAVRGRLRVNVDAAFGHHVLAPRISAFLEMYPELSLELLVRDRLGDFVGEGLDVAVRFGEPQPSALICRRLFETRVLTCAAPGYVARRGRPAHPKDLLEHECILFRDPATARPFEWEFCRGEERVPVPVSGRLTVNDTQSLLGACLGGHGIAQPLEFYIKEMLRDGRLVELLPDWAEERFPVYVYHQSRSLPSAKVRAFIDFVRDIAAALGGA